MKLSLLFFLVFTGCSIKSFAPSGGGLEMDIDIAKTDFRHGWAFLSKPFNTKTEVRDQDSIDRGKQLFLAHCQQCHGTNGKGGGELAKALKIKPADLTNLSRGLNNTYVLVQIKDGKGSMPMWKDFLTDKQALDLTSYIRDLSQK